MPLGVAARPEQVSGIAYLIFAPFPLSQPCAEILQLLAPLDVLFKPSSSRFTANDIVLWSRPIYFAASVMPIPPTALATYAASPRSCVKCPRQASITVQIIDAYFEYANVDFGDGASDFCNTNF